MSLVANRLARTALPLVVAGILTACGSGAVEGPGSEPAPATDSGQTNANGNGKGKGNGAGNKREYRFTLPIGKPGADQHEATAYDHLQQRECDAAEAHLDENWRGFDGPRNVLLFQAGVDFCRGDYGGGERWFHRAARYGWVGTKRDNVCELYQVAASVVHQRVPRSFQCQPGEDQWPTDDELARDDPRTKVNEGAGQASVDPDGEENGGASPGEANPDGASPAEGGVDDSPDTTE